MWKAYANTTGDANLDIAEYQLHRSTQQAFTPSAATRIAPIDKAVTIDSAGAGQKWLTVGCGLSSAAPGTRCSSGHARG